MSGAVVRVDVALRVAARSRARPASRVARRDELARVARRVPRGRGRRRAGSGCRASTAARSERGAASVPAGRMRSVRGSIATMRAVGVPSGCAAAADDVRDAAERGRGGVRRRRGQPPDCGRAVRAGTVFEDGALAVPLSSEPPAMTSRPPRRSPRRSGAGTAGARRRARVEPGRHATIVSSQRDAGVAADDVRGAVDRRRRLVGARRGQVADERRQSPPVGTRTIASLCVLALVPPPKR